MTPDSMSRAGLAAYVGFILISSVVGDFYPFTSYPMYSRIAADKQAVVFMADDEPADMMEFVDFSLDVGPLDGLIQRDNEHYGIDELTSYIRSHQAPTAATTATSRLALVLFHIRWNSESRAVDTTKTVLSQGTARRR